MPEPPPQPIDAIVPADSAERRLDAFLAGAFPDHSRTALRRAIDAGSIFVDGNSAKASYRVRDGQRITGTITAPPGEAPIPENIPIDILYEDESIAAINKPPGMVVHPAKGHWSGTLTSALAYHICELSSVGGSNRPGIVHRLDRDTSGVILVAKTDQAHKNLAAQFESRSVEKVYVAVCRGTLDRDQDIIEQPIGIHPYHREKMSIRGGHSTSREAMTVYHVIERFRGFCYVRLFPKTGRTHQIRVHMAHIGCPIVADRLYAGHAKITAGEINRDDNATVLLDRQALHAHCITFDHPASGERMTIEAPIPEDIARLLEALRTGRGLG